MCIRDSSSSHKLPLLWICLGHPEGLTSVVVLWSFEFFLEDPVSVGITLVDDFLQSEAFLVLCDLLGGCVWKSI